MRMKSRYVALGDLVVDCYYDNGVLAKIDGGGSKFNALCNLASRGNQTRVISACGNDLFGEIALNSLKIQKVDTTLVKRIGYQTKSYHLILEGTKHKSLKKCPICGKFTWYEESLISPLYCLDNVKEDEIIILDGLKEENIPILQYAKQPKVLDIGRINRLVNLKNEEILKLLQESKLEILQLNESVEKYFLARLGITSILQLYLLLGAKLLVVTRGKEGADFITDNFYVTKKLHQYMTEVDDTGAGDAFFSIIIQNYFDHNKELNKYWVDETFYLANQLTCNVVSNLGARGHLWDGYCSNKYNCICDM